jgi:hypothetical protein
VNPVPDAIDLLSESTFQNNERLTFPMIQVVSWQAVPANESRVHYGEETHGKR